MADDNEDKKFLFLVFPVEVYPTIDSFTAMLNGPRGPEVLGENEIRAGESFHVALIDTDDIAGANDDDDLLDPLVVFKVWREDGGGYVADVSTELALEMLSDDEAKAFLDRNDLTMEDVMASSNHKLGNTEKLEAFVARETAVYH